MLLSSRLRMLGFKAWLESRGRFGLCAAWTAGLCVIFILFQAPLRARMITTSAPDNTFLGYAYLRIYGGFVRGSFLFLALILGLGGLQRERHHNTIGFTLALPVSRSSLLLARAWVGIAQIVLLACIPAVLVPLLSAVAGYSYPWQQTVQFAVLWSSVGSAVFAFSLSVSAFIRAEYSALMISLAAFYLYPMMVVYVPIFQGRPLHIHYIMSGHHMPYLDPRTDLLVGPFPWTVVACLWLVTALFVALSVRATTVEDFS